jgi:hypothetical protein
MMPVCIAGMGFNPLNPKSNGRWYTKAGSKHKTFHVQGKIVPFAIWIHVHYPKMVKNEISMLRSRCFTDLTKNGLSGLAK